MFCSKCGKEIQDGMSICTECGSISKSAQEMEDVQKKNRMAEIERELNAVDEEQKRIIQSDKELLIKKKNLEKTCNKASKENKKAKSFRTKWNWLTVLFIAVILGCGIKTGSYIYNASMEELNTRISKLDQNAAQTIAAYENKFTAAIIQSRNSVPSNVLTESNKIDLNEYVRSLYRHPAERIQLRSFKNKEYYLVTDALFMDKYNLLDTTDNTIYPGAIVKGDSLFTGHYTVISTNRAPVTLMSNQGNTKPKQVSSPNYSNVTALLNEYAAAYSGDISKEWEYNMQAVSSSQELNVSLGVGNKSVNFDIGAKTENNKATTAITYSQTYYTVSAEPLQKPMDYFSLGADLQTLGGYEPAYVSSVSYGRKIILIVSGDMSQKELSAKLNLSISNINIGAGIQNVLKDETLSCQLICYGGKDISPILNTEEKNTGVVGDFKAWLLGDDEENSNLGERLNTFLSEPGSLINPVPISYNLKYLSDNADVPAMYINTESIMPADNAEFLTITSDYDVILNIAALPAIIVNAPEIVLEKGKAKGTYFELLWNSAYNLPLVITLNNKEYSTDLSALAIGEKILVPKINRRSFLDDAFYENKVEICKLNPQNILN